MVSRGRQRPSPASGVILRWMTGITTLAMAASCLAEPAYVAIPPASFVSVLATEKDSAPVAIAAYSMRTEPVTNAQFLAFVTANPSWRRDRVPSVFAEGRYLAHWQAAEILGDDARPQQPVTQVSWFAARAYCASEHARLPSWLEWERAASSSATVADARNDPKWRKQLLDWYARPSSGALDAIGGAENLLGVRDLHGLVWEWADDFNALMITADSRNQGDADRLKFCGEGALSLRDRDNYALLMRVAMLSSLKAADTTSNLGFRCVRDQATGS
ncbi:MAG: formylglycine-generating enzyme family protein [Dokdonella sp.]